MYQSNSFKIGLVGGREGAVHQERVVITFLVISCFMTSSITMNVVCRSLDVPVNRGVSKVTSGNFSTEPCLFVYCLLLWRSGKNKIGLHPLLLLCAITLAHK